MSENLFVQSGKYNIDSDVALTVTIDGDLVVTGAITGDMTFQSLTDTPAIYEPNKFVRVNALGDGLIYSETESLGGWDAGTTVGGISILQLADVNETTFTGHNGDVLTVNGDVIEFLPALVATNLNSLGDVVIGGIPLADGQILRYNGVDKFVNVSLDLGDDPTPQLGGDLDVGGNSIISSGGGNIAITPDSGGSIVLNGLSWPSDAGTVNYVLRTDGSSTLSWVAQSAGVTTFAALSDTAAYNGAGNHVVINGTNNGLSFVAAPAGAVSSVFTRIGAVVAAASDYDASQVDNDSGVAGAFVDDALNTLAGIVGTKPESFIALDDTDPITYVGQAGKLVRVNSGATGLEFSSPIVVPVDSVFTRTGAVVAAASDYDASQVDNDSGVAGAFVDDALNTLAGIVGTKPESFIALDDTDPVTYVGQAGKLVRVNSGATGLEFIAPTVGGLTDIEFDLSPELGADLDINGFDIISGVAEDIVLTPGAGGSVVLGQSGNAVLSTAAGENLILIPGTTGNLVLDGLNWPQADGTASYVLQTDGNGQLSWVAQTSVGSAAINDLSDVVITSAANNEVLAYNLATSQWFNQTPTEAGLATAAQGTLADSALQDITGESLNDLLDIVITSAADNEVLAYNLATSQWFNQTPAEAGLATAAQGTLADSALQAVSDDGAPVLGGNLDVGGNSIISSTGGNIVITPHTTGSIVLDGLNWPQIDGGISQILQTDGSGQLGWTALSVGAVNDLTDVVITAADIGDLIRYNGTNWVDYPDSNFATSAQGTLADSALQGITGESLNDLLDIVITSAANNEVLAYNLATSQWFNQTPTEAGLATAAQGTLADSALQDITGESLNDLLDIVITSAADNEVLAYNLATSQWFNQTPTEAGLATAAQGALADSALQDITGEALNDLSDVVITSAADNEVLAYNLATSQWFNQTPTEAGLLTDLVFDLSPELGADLDINGHNIVSGASEDIVLTPGAGGTVILGQGGSATLGTNAGENLNLVPGNGGTVVIGSTGTPAITTAAGEDLLITPGTTGNLVLDTLKWPQADGSADYVLITDGAGQLSWSSNLVDAQTEIDNIEAALNVTDTAGDFDITRFEGGGPHGDFAYSTGSETTLLEILSKFDAGIVEAFNWITSHTTGPERAYIVAPNGWILQFGISSTANFGTTAITLPIAWPTTGIMTLATYNEFAGGIDGSSTVSSRISTGSPTTQIDIFNADISAGSSPVNWFALGY